MPKKEYLFGLIKVFENEQELNKYMEKFPNKKFIFLY